MDFKVFRCETCGANLKQDSDGNVYCPSCGTPYIEQEDNTYITHNHNNNITKVYYGVAAQTENTKDRIAIYKARLYDELFSGNTAEARDYCVRLLNREPENASCILIKKTIEQSLRMDNGRYRKMDLSLALSLLRQAVVTNAQLNFDNEFYYYLNDYIRLYLAESRLSGAGVASVKACCDEINNHKANIHHQELLQTYNEFYARVAVIYANYIAERKRSEEEQERYLLEMQRRDHRRTMLKVIAVAIGILVVVLALIYAFIPHGTESTPQTEKFTVTYQSSTGGFVDIYRSAGIVKNDGHIGVGCEVAAGGTCDAIIAVPFEGYEFLSWSDGLTTAYRQDTNVTQSFTVTAYFRLIDNVS